MSRKYYIQDTRSFVGDSVLWWRPDGKGYTVNLDEAGEYEEERAASIYRNRETDKPIPVEVARAVASSHVIAGRLHAALHAAAEGKPAPKRAPPMRVYYGLDTACQAGRDGECNWKHCPQERDGGVHRRSHCVLDVDEDGTPEQCAARDAEVAAIESRKASTGGAS